MALQNDLLRSLLKKRGRREHGLFLLEGPALLEEALNSRLPLLEVRAAGEALESDPVRRAKSGGIPVVEETARALARLSDLETPPGIVAVARAALAPPAEILGRPGAVLLLAGVSDPGNAGTLIRAAEAFGAAGAIFGSASVEPYNPKVVRAAMGSLFRLPHAVATPGELVEAAADANRPLVAASRDGTPLPAFVFPENPVLAVGSERHGVGAWLSRWDEAVAIPHAGPTESLNAGVAGAIVLYEWSSRTLREARKSS